MEEDRVIGGNANLLTLAKWCMRYGLFWCMKWVFWYSKVYEVWYIWYMKYVFSVYKGI